jgi:hypothetical protein
MNLDRSQMKAYAGGLSGGLGVLAGATVSDDLAVVIAWLISQVGGAAPPEVAGAIAGLLVIVGGFFVGRLITYWSPPNETNPAGSVQAYISALEEMVKQLESDKTQEPSVEVVDIRQHHQ